MSARRITEALTIRECPGVSRGGRQVFELVEPMEYRVGHADSAEAIVVPPGFRFDFASIPFGFRDLFPPVGLHGRPACLHDFLYACRGDVAAAHHILPDLTLLQRAWMAAAVAQGVNRRLYTRKAADGVFLEAMKVVGVAGWRRAVMYRAVRLGGGAGWGR